MKKLYDLRYNNKEIYQGLKHLITDIRGRRTKREDIYLRLAYTMESLVLMNEKLLNHICELEEQLNKGEM